MRMSGKILVVPSAVLLVLLAGWASDHSGYYYATEDTKSGFFKRYTPEHMQEVMKPFLSINRDMGSNLSAGAGEKFVTNDRTIEPFFAVRPERAMPLMAAMRDDVAAQLTNDGATLLSQAGDPPDRVRITYRVGHSLGSAVLSWSVTNSRAPHYTQTGAMVEPPQGSEYMLANIAISEKWFPSEKEALQERLKTP